MVAVGIKEGQGVEREIEVGLVTLSFPTRDAMSSSEGLCTKHWPKE